MKQHNAERLENTIVRSSYIKSDSRIELRSPHITTPAHTWIYLIPQWFCQGFLLWSAQHARHASKHDGHEVKWGPFVRSKASRRGWACRERLTYMSTHICIFISFFFMLTCVYLLRFFASFRTLGRLVNVSISSEFT